MRTHHLMAGAALALVLASPAFANTSNVDQSESNHSATVMQASGKKGLSDIVQTGDTNTAIVDQSDVSPTPASGERNTSEIVQTGNFNLATVVQDNSEAGEASANTSTIEQLGSDATADVAQSGSGNTSVIEQD